MAGYGIISSLIGGGVDMAVSTLNNYLASEREAEARQRNYTFNESAANMADKRTRALYNDLYSPKAQIEQLQAAGLSPSVFYGDGGGISGQAGAQGQGTTGIAPNVFGADPLKGAQVANLLAEAGLKEAQKNELNGTNAMGQAKIENMLAEAGYKKEAAKLAKVQQYGQELDNYIRENGTSAELDIIRAKAQTLCYKSEIAFEELEQAKLLTEFNKETYTVRVQEEGEKLRSLTQSILESMSRVKLNATQIEQCKALTEKAYNDITLSWAELDVEKKRSQSYIKYLNEKTDYISKEYEAVLKGLEIRETQMIISSILDGMKSIAIGCMAYSSLSKAIMGAAGNYIAGNTTSWAW